MKERAQPKKSPAGSSARNIKQPTASKRGTKPTIRDVSRLARVSRMTVSRFFSNPELLLPPTRDQVSRAVTALSYVPDRTAGSLSSRRSGFIALILPTLTNSNFAALAHGLTAAIRPRNYQLLIGYTDYDVNEEERQIQQMLARRPEAIVVTGEHHSRHCASLLINSGVPVVEVADFPQRPIDLAIGFSNRDVGRMAATHLLDRGYRTIGAIGSGQSTAVVDFRGADRLLGFEEALRAAGRRVDLVLRHGTPPFSYESGASGLRTLLERAPDLDAVFVISDLGAVGVLMECGRRGVRVPDDLGVVGFGDFDIGAQMNPPLTTISVDFRDMGSRTGQLLLDVIQDGQVAAGARVTRVGMHLLERKSTSFRSL